MPDHRDAPALDHLTEGLRRVRSLHGRSARMRLGQALLEGPQSVREALAWHSGDVRALYLTPDADARHPELRATCGRVPLTLVTPEVAREMSSDAQGVLAVLRTDRGPAATTLADVDLASAGLVAVLTRPADPGNVGTVIRAADASGADAVVLAGAGVEHTSPKVLRSTAGSFFHLPVVAGVDVAGAVETLRGAGLQVLAADARGHLDLDDLLDAASPEAAVDLARPTAWVFGNEAHGLEADEVAACDAAVRVPIHGRAESLNLSVAAALCLYASARAQRRAAHTVDGDPR